MSVEESADAVLASVRVSTGIQIPSANGKVRLIRRRVKGHRGSFCHMMEARFLGKIMVKRHTASIIRYTGHAHARVGQIMSFFLFRFELYQSIRNKLRPM